MHVSDEHFLFQRQIRSTARLLAFSVRLGQTEESLFAISEAGLFILEYFRTDEAEQIVSAGCGLLSHSLLVVCKIFVPS